MYEGKVDLIKRKFHFVPWKASIQVTSSELQYSYTLKSIPSRQLQGEITARSLSNLVQILFTRKEFPLS